MGTVTSTGGDRTGEFKWILDDDERAQIISNLTCQTQNGSIQYL